MLQIDDTGNLQEPGLKTAFQDMPLAEHQKSATVNTITVCMAEAKDAKEDTVLVLRIFQFCVQREFANSCPKDLQDTAEGCNSIRAGKGKPEKSQP